jgi:hypothetical protein
MRGRRVITALKHLEVGLDNRTRTGDDKSGEL